METLFKRCCLDGIIYTPTPLKAYSVPHSLYPHAIPLRLQDFEKRRRLAEFQYCYEPVLVPAAAWEQCCPQKTPFPRRWCALSDNIRLSLLNLIIWFFLPENTELKIMFKTWQEGDKSQTDWKQGKLGEMMNRCCFLSFLKVTWGGGSARHSSTHCGWQLRASRSKIVKKNTTAYFCL